MTNKKEVIIYRGQEIDVGKIQNWLCSARNSDGTPYYTSKEIEDNLQREILNSKIMIGRLLGSENRERYGSWRLAFYQKEYQLFPEAYSTKVSDKNAIKIVQKLLKHFGKKRMSKTIHVRFWGNRQSGSSSWNEIRLSHNPSVGLICHEVGHKFVSRHSKKLMRFMKKAIRYCNKMNYWEMTLKEEILKT